MKIIPVINNNDNNLKNKNIFFKAKGISPEIRDAFINLSPNKRDIALKKLSEYLCVPISLLISFLGLENVCKNTLQTENKTKSETDNNLIFEKTKNFDVIKSKDGSDICYKKGNVTISEFWYDSGKKTCSPIKEKELEKFSEFIEYNILNNPKFEKFNIFIYIHMPYEKIFIRLKEKNKESSDNEYIFLEGTYKNGIIQVNFDKL